MRRRAAPARVNNLVVVSDLHIGCQLGLCDPRGADLDNGGRYRPSDFQRRIWRWWREFWDVFVPEATKGEPWALVVNGDCLEGQHHGVKTVWSSNFADQARHAQLILAPLILACDGRYYHVRGTEAHAGLSGEHEEQLARELGAMPSRAGNAARWDLWKFVGPSLVHLAHHVSTVGSMQFESTAVHRELVDSFTEAGRWHRRVPDVIVRSHRHRYVRTEIPTARGHAMAVTTPSWQGKTPFVWRGSGRLSEPQFGGLVVRHAHAETFIRPWVRSLEREAPE